MEKTGRIEGAPRFLANNRGEVVGVLNSDGSVTPVYKAPILEEWVYIVCVDPSIEKALIVKVDKYDLWNDDNPDGFEYSRFCKLLSDKAEVVYEASKQKDCEDFLCEYYTSLIIYNIKCV